VLFNEPKLLKFHRRQPARCVAARVSVLFNEPKLLKFGRLRLERSVRRNVSVLFNEPKLLKFQRIEVADERGRGFSALQRAEIAEIASLGARGALCVRFQCSSTSRNC